MTYTILIMNEKKQFPTCPLFELEPFELIKWYTTFVQSIHKRKHGYFLRAPNMRIRTNKSFAPIYVNYINEGISFALMSDMSVKVIHKQIKTKK